MTLSVTILEALRMRAELKQSGMPKEDFEHSFEACVRAVWPFTREWIYLCDDCNDTGWAYRHCPGDVTCGPSTYRAHSKMPCLNRPRRDHASHLYVEVCRCPKGQAMRSLETGAATIDDDLRNNAKGHGKKTQGRLP